MCLLYFSAYRERKERRKGDGGEKKGREKEELEERERKVLGKVGIEGGSK